MGRIEELREERRKLTNEIKRLEEEAKKEASGMHCGSIRCQIKQNRRDEGKTYFVSIHNPNRAGGKGVWYQFMIGDTKDEIMDKLQELINDTNELLNKLKEK